MWIRRVHPNNDVLVTGAKAAFLEKVTDLKDLVEDALHRLSNTSRTIACDGHRATKMCGLLSDVSSTLRSTHEEIQMATEILESMVLNICPSLSLSTPIYLLSSVFLFIYLSIHPSGIYLSISLSLFIHPFFARGFPMPIANVWFFLFVIDLKSQLSIICMCLLL